MGMRWTSYSGKQFIYLENLCITNLHDSYGCNSYGIFLYAV